MGHLKHTPGWTAIASVAPFILPRTIAVGAIASHSVSRLPCRNLLSCPEAYGADGLMFSWAPMRAAVHKASRNDDLVLMRGLIMAPCILAVLPS